MVELPKMKIEIHSLDYLRNPRMPSDKNGAKLMFQQNCYRLWYQVEGHGILHNATRNILGIAHEGLLGIMEMGERHAYLHQKGGFECFMMEFSCPAFPACEMLLEFRSRRQAGFARQ